MSEKSDLRIHRTRDRLGDALVALMLEKQFDEITVQHVLDRAGISRSTFYAHYRDKEDLFMSDVDDFWSSMSTILTRRGDESNRLAPVCELFAHVGGSRDFLRALQGSGRLHEVLELGRLHFARGILQRLPVSARNEAVAHALAGSLMSLLEWWIDHAHAISAEEMDRLFHKIAWTGVVT